MAKTTIADIQHRLPTEERLMRTVEKLTYLDDIFFKRCLKGNTEVRNIAILQLLSDA